MTRIVLADDHQLFLDGLLSLLSASSGIDIVGTALNGRSAIALLEKESPDLILLDVNMPEMDGIETTTYIKAHFPEVKVLILTMFNTPEFIGNLVACGADGYILKNTGREELLKRLVEVIDGKIEMPEEVEVDEARYREAYIKEARAIAATVESGGKVF